MINPFHATDLLWYPPDVFREYQKRSVAWNGLTKKQFQSFENRYEWLFLLLPSRNLLVQYQLWEHQKNAPKISFRVNIKTPDRSSHHRCSIKKGVLRNLTKFTGKHLCQSLFVNKVIKKEALAQVLSCQFCKISKNAFFYRTRPDDCFWPERHH